MQKYTFQESDQEPREEASATSARKIKTSFNDRNPIMPVSKSRLQQPLTESTLEQRDQHADSIARSSASAIQPSRPDDETPQETAAAVSQTEDWTPFSSDFSKASLSSLYDIESKSSFVTREPRFNSYDQDVLRAIDQNIDPRDSQGRANYIQQLKGSAIYSEMSDDGRTYLDDLSATYNEYAVADKKFSALYDVENVEDVTGTKVFNQLSDAEKYEVLHQRALSGDKTAASKLQSFTEPFLQKIEGKVSEGERTRLLNDPYFLKVVRENPDYFSRTPEEKRKIREANDIYDERSLANYFARRAARGVGQTASFTLRAGEELFDSETAKNAADWIDKSMQTSDLLKLDYRQGRQFGDGLGGEAAYYAGSLLEFIGPSVETLGLTVGGAMAGTAVEPGGGTVAGGLAGGALGLGILFESTRNTSRKEYLQKLRELNPNANEEELFAIADDASFYNALSETGTELASELLTFGAGKLAVSGAKVLKASSAASKAAKVGGSAAAKYAQSLERAATLMSPGAKTFLKNTAIATVAGMPSEVASEELNLYLQSRVGAEYGIDTKLTKGAVVETAIQAAAMSMLLGGAVSGHEVHTQQKLLASLGSEDINVRLGAAQQAARLISEQTGNEDLGKMIFQDMALRISRGEKIELNDRAFIEGSAAAAAAAEETGYMPTGSLEPLSTEHRISRMNTLRESSPGSLGVLLASPELSVEYGLTSEEVHTYIQALPSLERVEALKAAEQTKEVYATRDDSTIRSFQETLKANVHSALSDLVKTQSETTPADLSNRSLLQSLKLSDPSKISEMLADPQLAIELGFHVDDLAIFLKDQSQLDNAQYFDSAGLLYRSNSALTEEEASLKREQTKADIQQQLDSFRTEYEVKKEQLAAEAAQRKLEARQAREAVSRDSEAVLSAASSSGEQALADVYLRTDTSTKKGTLLSRDARLQLEALVDEATAPGKVSISENFIKALDDGSAFGRKMQSLSRALQAGNRRDAGTLLTDLKKATPSRDLVPETEKLEVTESEESLPLERFLKQAVKDPSSSLLQKALDDVLRRSEYALRPNRQRSGRQFKISKNSLDLLKKADGTKVGDVISRLIRNLSRGDVVAARRNRAELKKLKPEEYVDAVSNRQTRNAAYLAKAEEEATAKKAEAEKKAAAKKAKDEAKKRETEQKAKRHAQELKKRQREQTDSAVRVAFGEKDLSKIDGETALKSTKMLLQKLGKIYVGSIASYRKLQRDLKSALEIASEQDRVSIQAALKALKLRSQMRIDEAQSVLTEREQQLKDARAEEKQAQREEAKKRREEAKRLREAQREEARIAKLAQAEEKKAAKAVERELTKLQNAFERDLWKQYTSAWKLEELKKAQAEEARLRKIEEARKKELETAKEAERRRKARLAAELRAAKLEDRINEFEYKKAQEQLKQAKREYQRAERERKAARKKRERLENSVRRSIERTRARIERAKKLDDETKARMLFELRKYSEAQKLSAWMIDDLKKMTDLVSELEAVEETRRSLEKELERVRDDARKQKLERALVVLRNKSVSAIENPVRGRALSQAKEVSAELQRLQSQESKINDLQDEYAQVLEREQAARDKLQMGIEEAERRAEAEFKRRRDQQDAREKRTAQKELNEALKKAQAARRAYRKKLEQQRKAFDKKVEQARKAREAQLEKDQKARVEGRNFHEFPTNRRISNAVVRQLQEIAAESSAGQTNTLLRTAKIDPQKLNSPQELLVAMVASRNPLEAVDRFRRLYLDDEKHYVQLKDQTLAFVASFLPQNALSEERSSVAKEVLGILNNLTDVPSDRSINAIYEHLASIQELAFSPRHYNDVTSKESAYAYLTEALRQHDNFRAMAKFAILFMDSGYLTPKELYLALRWIQSEAKNYGQEKTTAQAEEGARNLLEAPEVAVPQIAYDAAASLASAGKLTNYAASQIREEVRKAAFDRVSAKIEEKRAADQKAAEKLAKQLADEEKARKEAEKKAAKEAEAAAKREADQKRFRYTPSKDATYTVSELLSELEKLNVKPNYAKSLLSNEYAKGRSIAEKVSRVTQNLEVSENVREAFKNAAEQAEDAVRKAEKARQDAEKVAKKAEKERQKTDTKSVPAEEPQVAAEVLLRETSPESVLKKSLGYVRTNAKVLPELVLNELTGPRTEAQRNSEQFRDLKEALSQIDWSLSFAENVDELRALADEYRTNAPPVSAWQKISDKYLKSYYERFQDELYSAALKSLAKDSNVSFRAQVGDEIRQIFKSTSTTSDIAQKLVELTRMHAAHTSAEQLALSTVEALRTARLLATEDASLVSAIYDASKKIYHAKKQSEKKQRADAEASREVARERYELVRRLRNLWNSLEKPEKDFRDFMLDLKAQLKSRKILKKTFHRRRDAWIFEEFAKKHASKFDEKLLALMSEDGFAEEFLSKVDTYAWTRYDQLLDDNVVVKDFQKLLKKFVSDVRAIQKASEKATGKLSVVSESSTASASRTVPVTKNTKIADGILKRYKMSLYENLGSLTYNGSRIPSLEIQAGESINAAANTTLQEISKRIAEVAKLLKTEKKSHRQKYLEQKRQVLERAKEAVLEQRRVYMAKYGPYTQEARLKSETISQQINRILVGSFSKVFGLSEDELSSPGSKIRVVKNLQALEKEGVDLSNLNAYIMSPDGKEVVGIHDAVGLSHGNSIYVFTDGINASIYREGKVGSPDMYTFAKVKALATAVHEMSHGLLNKNQELRSLYTKISDQIQKEARDGNEFYAQLVKRTEDVYSREDSEMFAEELVARAAELQLADNLLTPETQTLLKRAASVVSKIIKGLLRKLGLKISPQISEMVDDVIQHSLSAYKTDLAAFKKEMVRDSEGNLHRPMMKPAPVNAWVESLQNISGMKEFALRMNMENVPGIDAQTEADIFKTIEDLHESNGSSKLSTLLAQSIADLQTNPEFRAEMEVPGANSYTKSLGEHVLGLPKESASKAEAAFRQIQAVSETYDKPVIRDSWLHLRLDTAEKTKMINRILSPETEAAISKLSKESRQRVGAYAYARQRSARKHQSGIRVEGPKQVAFVKDNKVQATFETRAEAIEALITDEKKMMSKFGLNAQEIEAAAEMRRTLNRLIDESQNALSESIADSAAATNLRESGVFNGYDVEKMSLAEQIHLLDTMRGTFYPLPQETTKVTIYAYDDTGNLLMQRDVRAATDSVVKRFEADVKKVRPEFAYSEVREHSAGETSAAGREAESKAIQIVRRIKYAVKHGDDSLENIGRIEKDVGMLEKELQAAVPNLFTANGPEGKRVILTAEARADLVNSTRLDVLEDLGHAVQTTSTAISRNRSYARALMTLVGRAHSVKAADASYDSYQKRAINLIELALRNEDEFDMLLAQTHEIMRNKSAVDKVVGLGMGLSSAKILGFRPMTAAANIASIFIGLPHVLALYHGTAGVKEIGLSARVTLQRFMNKKMSPKQKKWLKYIRENELANPEISSAMLEEMKFDSVFSRKLQKVIGLSFKLLNYTETVVREVSLLAALETIEAKTPHLPFSEAMKRALVLSDKANGSFGMAGLEPIFHGQTRVFRPITMFMKYPLAQLTSLVAAFKSGNYSAAATNIAFTSLVFGIASNPVSALITALSSAFFGDDEEDKKNKMRRKLERGLLGQVLPVDIHGSFVFGLPSVDPRDAAIFEPVRATRLMATEIKKGNYLRAAAAMSPGGFSTTLRTIDEKRRGVRSSTGKPLFDYHRQIVEPSNLDVVYSLLGARGSKYAEKREDIRGVYETKKRLIAKRSKIREKTRKHIEKYGSWTNVPEKKRAEIREMIAQNNEKTRRYRKIATPGQELGMMTLKSALNYARDRVVK